MATDIKEKVIAKIKNRIEAPRFKSKIEVARLALKEYEKEQCNFYNNKLRDIKKRLEQLEISNTREKDQVDPKDFNEGYNQALIDYAIFTRKQINKHFCGRQKVWGPICKQCKDAKRGKNDGD